MYYSLLKPLNKNFSKKKIINIVKKKIKMWKHINKNYLLIKKREFIKLSKFFTKFSIYQPIKYKMLYGHKKNEKHSKYVQVIGFRQNFSIINPFDIYKSIKKILNIFEFFYKNNLLALIIDNSKNNNILNILNYQKMFIKYNSKWIYGILTNYRILKKKIENKIPSFIFNFFFQNSINKWFQREVITTNIPLSGLIDSNLNLNFINYPVFSNDDSLESHFFFKFLLDQKFKEYFIQETIERIQNIKIKLIFLYFEQKYKDLNLEFNNFKKYKLNYIFLKQNLVLKKLEKDKEWFDPFKLKLKIKWELLKKFFKFLNLKKFIKFKKYFKTFKIFLKKNDKNFNIHTNLYFNLSFSRKIYKLFSIFKFLFVSYINKEILQYYPKNLRNIFTILNQIKDSNLKKKTKIKLKRRLKAYFLNLKYTENYSIFEKFFFYLTKKNYYINTSSFFEFSKKNFSKINNNSFLALLRFGYDHILNIKRKKILLTSFEYFFSQQTEKRKYLNKLTLRFKKSINPFKKDHNEKKWILKQAQNSSFIFINEEKKFTPLKILYSYQKFLVLLKLNEPEIINLEDPYHNNFDIVKNSISYDLNSKNIKLNIIKKDNKKIYSFISGQNFLKKIIKKHFRHDYFFKYINSKTQKDPFFENSLFFKDYLILIEKYKDAKKNLAKYSKNKYFYKNFLNSEYDLISFNRKHKWNINNKEKKQKTDIKKLRLKVSKLLKILIKKKNIIKRFLKKNNCDFKNLNQNKLKFVKFTNLTEESKKRLRELKNKKEIIYENYKKLNAMFYISKEEAFKINSAFYNLFIAQNYKFTIPPKEPLKFFKNFLKILINVNKKTIKISNEKNTRSNKRPDTRYTRSNTQNGTHSFTIRRNTKSGLYSHISFDSNSTQLSLRSHNFRRKHEHFHSGTKHNSLSNNALDSSQNNKSRTSNTSNSKIPLQSRSIFGKEISSNNIRRRYSSNRTESLYGDGVRMETQTPKTMGHLRGNGSRGFQKGKLSMDVSNRNTSEKRERTEKEKGRLDPLLLNNTHIKFYKRKTYLYWWNTVFRFLQKFPSKISEYRKINPFIHPFNEGEDKIKVIKEINKDLNINIIFDNIDNNEIYDGYIFGFPFFIKKKYKIKKKKNITTTIHNNNNKYFVKIFNNNNLTIRKDLILNFRIILFKKKKEIQIPYYLRLLRRRLLLDVYQQFHYLAIIINYIIPESDLKKKIKRYAHSYLHSYINKQEIAYLLKEYFKSEAIARNYRYQYQKRDEFNFSEKIQMKNLILSKIYQLKSMNLCNYNTSIFRTNIRSFVASCIKNNIPLNIMIKENGKYVHKVIEFEENISEFEIVKNQIEIGEKYHIMKIYKNVRREFLRMLVAMIKKTKTKSILTYFDYIKIKQKWIYLFYTFQRKVNEHLRFLYKKRLKDLEKYYILLFKNLNKTQKGYFLNLSKINKYDLFERAIHLRILFKTGIKVRAPENHTIVKYPQLLHHPYLWKEENLMDLETMIPEEHKDHDVVVSYKDPYIRFKEYYYFHGWGS